MKTLLYLLIRYRDKHFPPDGRVAAPGTIGRAFDDVIEYLGDCTK